MVSTTNFLQNFCSMQLLLVFNWQVADATLKCFSGDPAFRSECTSLSYCLYITSRNGRTQWSCDGNALSQVSLCSTLGLQHDLAEEATLYGERNYRGKSENKLVRTPYESTAISSNRYYPPRSLSGGNSRETGLSSSRRFSATPLAPELRCFNGGDLGQICCCSTDFCNYAFNNFCVNTKTLIAAMLFLLWRHLQNLLF
ncbi:hypothetical protein M3Y97_00118800 [Aphelenchoides bicaudatus]|nr:hypothetical protein M3Y97_00118800 [Aphelenchoides bicaudatus]